MGMTMTQKILAAHAGLPEVKAGQLIRAKLDMVLGNDITSPVAIREFEKEGFTGVFDKSKISMVMDHFTPNKDIKAAEQCLQCRTFARQFDLDNFYDVGQMGVEPRPSGRKRAWWPRGMYHRRGLPHLQPMGPWGLSTGVAPPSMAGGMGHGETWFKVPEAIPGPPDRQAPALGQRQGCHPPPDRPDRRGRRPVPESGILRGRCGRPVHG